VPGAYWRSGRGFAPDPLALRARTLYSGQKLLKKNGLYRIVGLLEAEDWPEIQFVSLVIEYLTQSGWMRAAQLYESPFTDFSPRGVEGVFDSAQVTQLLSVLDNIRQAAAAS